MATDHEFAIMTELAEIKGKISAVETNTNLIRTELLGNGQPGRMKLAENAIQALQEERRFRDGVIYSVNAIITLLIATLISHGASIWHYFFPPKH